MDESFSHNICRLKQTLHEIQKEKDALEQDNTLLNQENKTLKEKIGRLYAKQADADSKAVVAFNEVRSLHQRNVNLLKEDHKEEIKKNQDIISRLQENVEQFKADIEKYKTSLQDSKASSVKSNVIVTTLEETIARLKKENEDKDDLLANTKAKIEEEHEKVLSRLRVRNRILEDQLKTLRSENESKKSKLTKIKIKSAADMNKSESIAAKHDDQMKAFEQEIKQLLRDVKEKSACCSELSRQLSTKDAETKSLISKHCTQVKALDENIFALDELALKKDKEIFLIKKQMQNVEAEKESLISQHKIQIDLLEKKASALKCEGKRKEEELCRVSKRLFSLEGQTESSAMKQQLLTQSLKEQISCLEEEVADKNNKLTKINSKLASYEADTQANSLQQHSNFKMLEDKLVKLEQSNKNKEEQLCKISSRLTQSEIEGDSMASKYRHKLVSLEKELETLKAENKDKNNQLSLMEAQASVTETQLKSFKDKLRSLTIECSQKENDLIRALQLDKKKLDEENSRLKQDISETSQNLSIVKCDLAEMKCTVIQKECLLEEQANKAKTNLIQTVEDFTRKLKDEENRRILVEKDVMSVAIKREQIDNEEKSTICELHKKISILEKDISSVKKEKAQAEERCNTLQIENSFHLSSSDQLDKYKEKLEQMQNINSELIEQHEVLLQEQRDLNRKMEQMRDEQATLTKTTAGQEKTIKMLKESCAILEKQTEDLEMFNNQLIEKQNVLSTERDEALKKSSDAELELRNSKLQLKTELSSLDQLNSDQMTEMKIELRTKLNEAHEAAEQHRDLERRYKNLELNAAALQRKLNIEKESHNRCMDDIGHLKGEIEVLQQSLKRSEENLHAEINRCDELELEKTQTLNRVDSEKLEFSHELIRMNCQGAQQTKLIDFLQSRVEELESSDKKRKKKKTRLYQAPLQYRELCDLLDEEKASNVKLQNQVNMLRSELQVTNSKVKRMKHGMDTPLSPGSIAAISAIVKSPVTTSADISSLSPKANKLRSKPRMSHNIPHRLSNWVCHRATRCSVCLTTIYFGHTALSCLECSVVCHTKCSKSVTNTCGLPGGLYQQFKEGPKSSTLSPITCVFKGSNSDELHGKLKVLCDDDTWNIRLIRVSSGQIHILPPSGKSLSNAKDDVIDLKHSAYIQTDLNQTELPGTTKQDLQYAFKIQTGSTNSCWPARSIYLLAAGFAEKHMWVEKLETITTQHSHAKSITSNAKIFGNEILSLLSDEKLEINCSLPVSDKTILFGCDEGLFVLSPSTTSVSSRANMAALTGVLGVYQLALLDSQIIAIEGPKHKLVSFELCDIEKRKLSMHSIEDVEGCHLFAVGQAEGSYYLSVASGANITVFKYNARMKKFCKKKEIATSEPCTCMVFTACSVIIGTNDFYEIDLTDYRVDEFLDCDDATRTLFDDGSVFPMAVLKIKDHCGKQEFLLCFHEFGIFVDGFGHQTRSGRMTWSRMPLSFEYRRPYLIIVQFNSVEIIQIAVDTNSSAETTKLDHAFLSFPRARFLGPAITEGAVYLSSIEGNKMSVFCCKGNMKENHATKSSAGAVVNKRLHDDTLASPATKRAPVLADFSNLPYYKNNTDSTRFSESSTSRWSELLQSEDDVQFTSTSFENESNNSETTSSNTSNNQDSSNAFSWHPAKTAPAKPSRKNIGRRRQVPSTEV